MTSSFRFTFHISRFTFAGAFATDQCKTIKVKAWKNVKGKMINKATGGSV